MRNLGLKTLGIVAACLFSVYALAGGINNPTGGSGGGSSITLSPTTSPGTYYVPLSSTSTSPGLSALYSISGLSANGSTGALTANALTVTSTFSAPENIHALGAVTTYTILSTDQGLTVTSSGSSANAITLPQAGTTGFEAGKAFGYINLGSGAATMTPSTSTINGASSYVFDKGYGGYIISDGTNWNLFAGISASGGTFAQSVRGPQSSLSLSTTTFTPDLTNQHFLAVLTTACVCAIANPSNISTSVGQTGIIEIDQPAAATTTVSWGSDYKFAGGTSPTLSTTTGAQDYFSYYVKDSTDVIVSGGVLNAK